MRGKIKSRKIKVILIASILIVITSAVCSVYVLNNKTHKTDIIDKNDKVEKINISSDEILEEIIEDKGEESATEEIKDEVSNTPKTNNNGNSNKKSSTTNTQKSTPKNNSELNTSVSETSTNKPQSDLNNSSNKETAPKEPSVDLTKVVSTNDINYDIHKGIVEFATNSGCERAGNDIVNIELDQVIAYNSENDNSKSVDIRYTACYQVTSQANTIMGYYLNIYCESGNCNRYKSLVNISNYN